LDHTRPDQKQTGSAETDVRLETAIQSALSLLLPKDADPLLARFSTYWLNARGGRTAPRYKDLDPVGMPWALPAIFVVQSVAGEPFRYRLAGENMQTRLTPSLRGKTAFDIFEQSYAEWTERRWRKAADELLASYVHTRHETANGRHVVSQRILFPTLDEEQQASILIGVSVFISNSWRSELGTEDRDHRSVRWTALQDLPHETAEDHPARL
jgi:hypothetical protein